MIPIQIRFPEFDFLHLPSSVLHFVSLTHGSTWSLRSEQVSPSRMPPQQDAPGGLILGGSSLGAESISQAPSQLDSIVQKLGEHIVRFSESKRCPFFARK